MSTFVTTKFSESANWAKGIDKRGARSANPPRTFDIGGARSSRRRTPAPSTGPRPRSALRTGLFYRRDERELRGYYLTETDPRGAMGFGGKEEQNVATFGTFLLAIDYQTGKPRWKRHFLDSARGAAHTLAITT